MKTSIKKMNVLRIAVFPVMLFALVITVGVVSNGVSHIESLAKSDQLKYLKHTISNKIETDCFQFAKGAVENSHCLDHNQIDVLTDKCFRVINPYKAGLTEAVINKYSYK